MDLKSFDDYWYGWNYTPLENGFLSIKALIEKIESLKIEPER